MAARLTHDDSVRKHLEEAARAAGFHVARFARVRRAPDADHLDRWLARGGHADMSWMPRTRDTRVEPRARMPTARTAMVLGVDHAHVRPPDPGGRTGMVARYAWGRDYHNLVGKRLKRLQRGLRADGIAAWGGVDTAPILERSWAAAAGLGFPGKNTVQIVPGRTSWMFLAVVFVDVEARPDAPLADHCGRCTRCLVACPTDAFRGPHELDASRCISYWTIEASTLPPPTMRTGFGRWVFGCDVCQEVCPHNHHPPDPEEEDFRPRHAWLDLDRLLATPDDALMERFTGTPLRRPRASGLKRNAAIVLGNLADDGAVDVLRSFGLTHAAPVVRGASVWALRQLGAPTPADDPDETVRAEIRRPLPAAARS
jgi:epoxyqueuosine reductase